MVRDTNATRFGLSDCHCLGRRVGGLLYKEGCRLDQTLNQTVHNEATL